MIPREMNDRLAALRDTTSVTQFAPDDQHAAEWGWQCYKAELRWLSLQNYVERDVKDFKGHLSRIMDGMSRRFKKSVWKKAHSHVILGHKPKTPKKWEMYHARHV
jgi:hypothetical protein